MLCLPDVRGLSGTGCDPVSDDRSPVAPPGGATALRLHELTWRPLSRREPTLDALTLEIPAGQHVLLTGASGSGKSTLLQALAGLLDPTAGDLTGTMQVPSRPGERALLLQNPADALVGANVGRDTAFGPENAQVDRAEIHARVAAALRVAAVDVDADRDPLQASGGQQQRIALAGALALHPGVLLLDEPCSMLDAAAAQRVRAAVRDAARTRTMVVADHDAAAWWDHVDRVIVLGERGRILQDAAPDALPRPAPLTAQPSSAPPSAASEQDHAADPSEPTDQTDAHAGQTGLTQTPTDSPRDASPGAAAPPVLTATDLSIGTRRRRHRGPDPQARVLLKDLSLALQPGQMHLITGPSGSGKTSLLRALLGLDAPLNGEIQRPDPAQLAFVPQNPEHSFVAPTVRDELLASRWADDEQRADVLLHATGLNGLAGANPYTLSGGEQRRLAIGAALASAPQLLVLDEPTVGLDAQRCAAVLTLLEQARAQGAAVVVASHDPRLVPLADRVITLGDADVEATVPSPVSAPRSGRPSPTPEPRRQVVPVVHRPVIPADRLNPLTLCLIGILGAAGSFAVQTWQGGLLALVPILLLAPLTMRSLGGALLRLTPVLLSAASLAWTTALLGTEASLSGAAWLVGLKEAARITVFVAPGVLTLGAIDPTALGDALGQRLRAPARPVVASVAGLVRASQLDQQWQVIVQTRRLRGLGTGRSVRLLASATLALLVQSLRGAQQQALALDSRGFATAHQRTWALPAPFRGADVVGIMIGVLLLVWPLAAQMLVL